MKRKLLRTILAVVPAVLMPLAALSQIAPEKPARVSTEPVYKYEAFAGWGYTSLNQVNQSRSGLQGYTLSLTRDWGRYFGVTVDGSQYIRSVTVSNVGSPVVDLFLAGPVVHAQLYERLSGFAHALLGVEHTGGVTISPNASLPGAQAQAWSTDLPRAFRCAFTATTLPRRLPWFRSSRATRHTSGLMRAPGLA